MGDVPDFITRFHNLDGDIIGERKKSLYKLIINPSLFPNEQQRNDTLDKLEPKTYQESLFYVDILIYFKRTEKLAEILKGGNQLFATKILKQPWFFAAAFKNIEAGKLVNEYLPYFSYVVRKKLLTRVSKCWPENKMDALYDALNNKYGLSAAIPILQKCSSEKVKTILNIEEIKLRPNQVIELFNKNEDTFKLYLDHFKTIKQCTYDESKVVNYVALKNPKLLLELQKNEKISVRSIGRRTTKGIMKVSKDDISQDCKRYTEFLNRNVLVKTLGAEFKTVYKQLFPKSFLGLNSFCSDDKLIKNYPKSKRWELFRNICAETFANKSDVDVLSTLDEKIKTLQPPKDVLYKWAEIKYEKQDSNSNDFLKYYPASKAVAMIKEKINITSDTKRRAHLLELLISACAENKDLPELEKVLEYISTRHKTEIADTRNNLLTHITRVSNYDDLNEVHWKYIHEQLVFLKVQKDFRFYLHAELYIQYLKFLFKHGKDTKPALTEYLKSLMEDRFYREFDLKDRGMERDIYIGLCKVFPEVVPNESKDYRKNTSSFIQKIFDFSLTNSKYAINITDFPEFVSVIQATFDKENKLENHDLELIAKFIVYFDTYPQYCFAIENSTILHTVSTAMANQKSIWWISNTLTAVVAKKNRSALGNELFNYYFNNAYDKYSEQTLVPWFLKNEPRSILPYFEIILKNNFVNVWSYHLDNTILKQYSHLGLDKQVKEYILKHLQESNVEETTKISNDIKHVYPLFTIEEFIKFIEDSYLPKQDKLDLEDKEMRNLFKIQCDIAKILANVDEPYKMLPTIMKYAKGDYLQSALPSLYKAFYKSPERLLYSYIEQLAKQAVSARKHAIFLSCELLDKEHTINILKTTKQKNISSQKHLFSATLKYFLKNPSQDLLDKVIESMSTIDKNDTETLESLKNANIPRKYRSQYIEKCWYFYESLEESNIKIHEYLQGLVEFISENILVNLSDQFVTYVIKKYFVNDRSVNLDNFVIGLLKVKTSNRNKIFDLVFEMLLKLNSHLVNTFFNNFLYTTLYSDVDKNCVLLFSQYWHKNFILIKTLKAHIALKLLLLRLDNLVLENYAQSVVNYMEEMLKELGFLVFSVFWETLKEVLNHFKKQDRYNFLLAILKYKTDANTCVVVMQLMDAVHADDEKELRDVFDRIIDILKQVDVPIVIAYYKSYLANNDIE